MLQDGIIFLKRSLNLQGELKFSDIIWKILHSRLFFIIISLQEQLIVGILLTMCLKTRFYMPSPSGLIVIFIEMAAKKFRTAAMLLIWVYKKKKKA